MPYADVPHNQQTPEIKWLRANPHRLHLGQIGFVLKHADGSLATTNDLTDIEQKLDLWNGEIISHFKFDGQPVDVETVCDPKLGCDCRAREIAVGEIRAARDSNSFSLRHGRH